MKKSFLSNIPIVAAAAALAACLLTSPARLNATSVSVTLTPDCKIGAAVSPNFAGMALEEVALEPNNWAPVGYEFDNNPTQSPGCQQVVALLNNMSLEHIRIGAGSTESTQYNVDYDNTAITAFFNCVNAVPSIKNVIWQVRLLGTTTYSPVNDDATNATFVWSNYKSNLDTFAIGNEPTFDQWHTTDPNFYDLNPGIPLHSGVARTAYPTYLEFTTGNATTGKEGVWKVIADHVVSQIHSIDPTATPAFDGPDGGDTVTNHDWTYWPYNSGTVQIPWEVAMAKDRSAGNDQYPLPNVTTHYYMYGSSTTYDETTGLQQLLADDSGTLTGGQGFSQNDANIGSKVYQTGWHYRFTEASDHFQHQTIASTEFASALWALDFMHWERAHNYGYCSGVDFMDNGNSALIYRDSNGNWQARPRAGAIKMFHIGGHGYNEGVASSPSLPSGVSVYAVGDSSNLYVTIINKTSSYTNNATDVATTITPANLPFTATHADRWVMNSSPTANEANSTVVAVGSATINNSGTWNGTPGSLTVDAAGNCSTTCYHCSAIIVHIY